MSLEALPEDQYWSLQLPILNRINWLKRIKWSTNLLKYTFPRVFNIQSPSGGFWRDGELWRRSLCRWRPWHILPEMEIAFSGVYKWVEIKLLTLLQLFLLWQNQTAYLVLFCVWTLLITNKKDAEKGKRRFRENVVGPAVCYFQISN